MNNFKFDLENLFCLCICICISVFGTLANLLSRVEKEKITITKVLANIMIMIFFGSLTYLVWTLIELPIQYSFILSGLVGFYGRGVFESLLKDKTGIDIKDS